MQPAQQLAPAQQPDEVEMYEGEDLLLLNGSTPTKFGLNVAYYIFGNNLKNMVLTNNSLSNVNPSRTPISADKVGIIKSKTIYIFFV